MAFTVVQNAPDSATRTGANRHEAVEMDGSDGVVKVWLDTLGIVAMIGRGQSDPNITYVALKNTNGTTIYFYPNAAGDGPVVTSVQP